MRLKDPFEVSRDGTIKFEEKDGTDYATVKVQLPVGESVPFLFFSPSDSLWLPATQIVLVGSSSCHHTEVHRFLTRRDVVDLLFMIM